MRCGVRVLGYFSPECNMNLFTEGDWPSQNAKVEATGMPQIPRLVRADGPKRPKLSLMRIFIALRRVIFLYDLFANTPSQRNKHN